MGNGGVQVRTRRNPETGSRLHSTQTVRKGPWRGPPPGCRKQGRLSQSVQGCIHSGPGGGPRHGPAQVRIPTESLHGSRKMSGKCIMVVEYPAGPKCRRQHHRPPPCLEFGMNSPLVSVMNRHSVAGNITMVILMETEGSVRPRRLRRHGDARRRRGRQHPTRPGGGHGP